MAAARSAVFLTGERQPAKGRAVLLSFRGSFEAKVDAKGRVSVPPAFRRILEAEDPEWTKGLNPNLVVVFGDEKRRHLECFTVNAIAEVDALIRRHPRGSIKRRRLHKLYNHLSLQASVDETGRLVLTPKLRGEANIGPEALFVGNGDTFEIWNPEVYEAEEDALALRAGEDFDPDLDASVYLDDYPQTAQRGPE